MSVVHTGHGALAAPIDTGPAAKRLKRADALTEEHELVRPGAGLARSGGNGDATDDEKPLGAERFDVRPHLPLDGRDLLQHDGG